MACAICHERKEKRFCPAVHDKICPICCGTEREVTLDCPSECPWLQQARKNENAEHLRELDREALMPEVEVPDAILYQWEPLIGGLSFALAKASRADRAVFDRDIIEALTSLAKSYETLVNSGLIVEQKTTNLAHQAISADVSKMIEEYRELETKRIGYSRLRDSDVLKVLVFVLRLALGRTSGRPKSRAFLDFLHAQFPEKRPLEAADAPRIIVP